MTSPESPHALVPADPAAPTVTSVGHVPMERLRSIFDGMFDGVWLVGADQRTTYANESMATLLGTTPAQMRDRAMVDFVDVEMWPAVVGFLDRQQRQAGERMELRLRRIDGSDLFGLIAGSPILGPDGAFVGTMLNVSDMTGKHSLDAQLVQSQRLEAVGRFAGGVAHDFNNLLTTIRGFAELAHDGLRAGDPVRDDVAQVLAGTDKAARIVRTLLAFARRQVLVPVDVDPGQVVAGLVPVLRPLLGDGVGLEVRVAPAHSLVRVDRTQLELALVNLAMNAHDAMPDGGTLTLTVQDLGPADPTRPDPDLSAGPFVRISVTDTGVGMDEATRARIFDPYFSTKGDGPGLGLAAVLGIVTQSGGRVGVETTPGGGTTFAIDLPCAGSEQPRVRELAGPAGIAPAPLGPDRDLGEAGPGTATRA